MIKLDIEKDTTAACTCGPLVYVRTLKCASSFFYNNLVETYRWDEINYKDINWGEQHVFGHLLDPLERRHKGILEFLIMRNSLDLLENPVFQNLIKDVHSLDEHSYSYHSYYGRMAYLIDWIPLNRPHHEITALTEKLLWKFGIRNFSWDQEHARPASDEMRYYLNILKEIWPKDRYQIQLGTQEFLSRDKKLYDQVVGKFNPHGDTWNDISWLRA